LPSADIFRTVVIQMRTFALFVAKTNIKFFKVYIVCPHLTWTGGRGIEPVLTFFRTREGQFFMILVDVLYGLTLSKKNSKLSMGYRPTNCNR